MNKKKIAFFDLRKSEGAFYKKHLSDHELVLSKNSLSQETVKECKNCDVVSVFISSKLDAALLQSLPKLKFIATRSTGFDHIDLKYCKSKGIAVSNVPSYGENTVAEHAMTLLLHITKRISESVERVKDGNFSPQGLTGTDLKGKVIGVLGTGHIGRCFIQMALGFGAKVIAYDLYPNSDYAEEMGFEYVDFNYLIKKSDIISLHLPYTKKTHHLIDRSVLEKVKHGVIIINTARGGLIETDALFDALKDGRVGGAGLDVLEEEGFLREELELLYADVERGYDYKIALENHMMAHLPNVIITPHNAFNTKEALQRITDTTLQNIQSFLENKPQNLVN